MRKNLDEPQHISTFINRGYARKLQDPRWQKLRLERMELSKWKCDQCGDGSNELQVHHNWYLKNLEPWEYHVSQLTTLCDSCHESTTQLQDDLKRSLSYSNPETQKLCGLMIERHTKNTCELTRHDDPQWVNARVAKCFAISVQWSPRLLLLLVRLHDSKGCLQVYSEKELEALDVGYIRSAWHHCGESEAEFYTPSGCYYRDNGIS